MQGAHKRPEIPNEKMSLCTQITGNSLETEFHKYLKKVSNRIPSPNPLSWEGSAWRGGGPERPAICNGKCARPSQSRGCIWGNANSQFSTVTVGEGVCEREKGKRRDNWGAMKSTVLQDWF